MYARVAELARVTPRTRAVDLFAGLGGMGLAIARAGAAAVVAVEIDRDAVGQLRRAAARADLPVTPIAGDAGDLPSEIRAQLGDARPDVVVVNPPRKGLGEGATDLVIALDAPVVIYASCGPESLGRDLAALAKHGYEADVIEPFDLMPGTAQIETVVRLVRGDRATRS
jgi:tRNA/tmRNA/rRNA uracil-C5-methylase (TrmA/RlmC/RlmD family)